jgi:hypothetical protein
MAFRPGPVSLNLCFVGLQYYFLSGHDFTGCGKTQSEAHKRQGMTLVVPIKP